MRHSRSPDLFALVVLRKMFPRPQDVLTVSSGPGCDLRMLRRMICPLVRSDEGMSERCIIPESAEAYRNVKLVFLGRRSAVLYERGLGRAPGTRETSNGVKTNSETRTHCSGVPHQDPADGHASPSMRYMVESWTPRRTGRAQSLPPSRAYRRLLPLAYFLAASAA